MTPNKTYIEKEEYKIRQIKSTSSKTSDNEQSNIKILNSVHHIFQQMSHDTQL